MFLHDIVSTIVVDEIPDELILNVDQTPSKFALTDNVTMAEKSSKHVSSIGRGAFQPWTHSCPNL